MRPATDRVWLLPTSVALTVTVAVAGMADIAVAQGIASRYPGDVGIAADPAVVFAENFEAATLAEVVARWDDAKNVGGMSLVGDVPASSSGTLALRVTSIIGSNTGGHLYQSFPAGHDILYARFYTKLAADCHPVHHFVGMGGYNPPTPWPQGGAGIRPDGSDRFTTAIEPMGTDWRWDFYTYWMHMRGNPGPDFWGNVFYPTPAAAVPCGEWIAVELMLEVNDPVTSFNGEQGFWIDGVERHRLGEGFPNGDWVWDKFYPNPSDPPFEGFQWRIADALRINFFWLSYYMTAGAPGQLDSVLFDDVVVATEYIGPIAPLAGEPTLHAVRRGADVALTWTDVGGPAHRLERADEPTFAAPTVLFDGAGVTSTDAGAARVSEPNHHYRVD